MGFRLKPSSGCGQRPVHVVFGPHRAESGYYYLLFIIYLQMCADLPHYPPCLLHFFAVLTKSTETALGHQIYTFLRFLQFLSVQAARACVSGVNILNLILLLPCTGAGSRTLGTTLQNSDEQQRQHVLARSCSLYVLKAQGRPARACIYKY